MTQKMGHYAIAEKRYVKLLLSIKTKLGKNQIGYK